MSNPAQLTKGPLVESAELYPMRVVARVTGLPADTVRAWERRYEAVTPHRTAGNARRYSAADIRKLTILRDLTEQGHAISAIAALTLDKLEAMVAAEARNDDPALAEVPTLDAIRERYLSAVARMETKQATDVLLRASAVLDNRQLVFDLVIPLVQAVGQRWAHGELGVAQEHLVSAELRGLLSTRARLVPSVPGAPRMLISTPAGHRHEFGVLASALLAAGRGLDVVYLGPDMPDDELVWSAGVGRASIMVLGVARALNAMERDALGGLLERLAPVVEVWLGAPAGGRLPEIPENVRVFYDFESFDVAAAAIGGGVTG